MLKVGLTGGIGSGKSTVARIFEVLGIPVFLSDAEARSAQQEDPALRSAIQSRFGPVYGPSGLDRAALAAIVFNDPGALADLNALVHPVVRRRFQEWSARQDAPYVVNEAAILIESGGHVHMDLVVVVTAPEAVRTQRVMLRDGVDQEQVRARMRNQMNEEARLAQAGLVIDNGGGHLVIPQVLALHEQLVARSNA